MSNSVAAGNVAAGFSAVGTTAVLNIEHSVAASNGTGCVCSNSTLRIGNMSISGNGAAVATAGTNCFRYGNNNADASIAALTLINPQ